MGGAKSRVIHYKPPPLETYTSKAKIIETRDIITENIEAHIAPDACRLILAIALSLSFMSLPESIPYPLYINIIP